MKNFAKLQKTDGNNTHFVKESLFFLLNHHYCLATSFIFFYFAINSEENGTPLPYYIIGQTKMTAKHKRMILISLAGILVLIPAGLVSRHISSIPEETGDAIWAMMVFCLWRIIFVKKDLRLIAIVSLAHSFLVEFSQLIRWPWLVSFRSTFWGHMMLGQGFLWTDLLAYLIGIAVIYSVYNWAERRCCMS